jgi:hypothetical protein
MEPLFKDPHLSHGARCAQPPDMPRDPAHSNPTTSDPTYTL